MSRQMSIEGIFYHIQAIIAQGRTEDYLAACKERGFISLEGPDGIIAYTREFIAMKDVPDSAPTLSAEMNTQFKSILGRSLKSLNNNGDFCDC